MSKKIYIVEDMAVTRIALESIILDHGFSLAGSASNAHNALEFLQSEVVDLVLMDIQLIGKATGLDLTKKIRNFSNVPIIFITANGDSKTIKKIIELKADGYIMKPFKEPEVVATITIELNKTQAAKAFKNDNYIEIKHKNKILKLETNAINYMQSNGNYIEIITDTTAHLHRESLKSFIKRLQDKSFLQIHLRYAINTKNVTAYSKTHVEINGINLPISRSFQANVLNILKENNKFN